MTTKVIFACVGCAAAGFVAGWATRALVKKKNDELKIIGIDLAEEDTMDDKRSEKQNNIYIKNITKDDEDRIINNYISKKYRQETFSDVEKDAIEQANAEAESPKEEDYEEGNPEEDPDYAEDYSSSSYDPEDDYDDYKPQPRYDQFSYSKSEDENDDDKKENKMHKKNIWPYEISIDEFEEDNDFSKTTLEYYKNNVLIDEDGDEITNPGSIIGSGVLKNLMVSKDTAYVRNESLEIDYEIVYIDERYERYDDEY